jgi:predicted lipoprotein with Yx(FWY)xxD motif
MFTLTQARIRAGGAVALVGAALVVAGCGSSSSSSSASSAAANASQASSASNVSVKGVAVSTAKGADGTYLTGASGRALYLWVADKNDTSSCSGSCAGAWPPLVTKGQPKAGTGVDASDLGTITRTGGIKQVTYKGHHLYYFVEDSHGGMVKGQGSDSFGAKWWLVAPAGTAITAGTSSGGSASNASGSSSGSSGGGVPSGY